ncbi:DegT/DnrJ/EryC1/StrS family aminotransferase [Acidobacteriota bacterium]
MIPVNEPLMARNTQKYVNECIETGWISSAGKYIKRFEEEFAEYLNVRHAITTTSGTTALHLSLVSCGIGAEDAVLIPSLTMIAVPYAVLYTGALPIPLDVDYEIFNLDPEGVREYLQTQCRFSGSDSHPVDNRTGRTIKAILPVHLYGHPCQMEKILELAKEFNLLVIEDAAEAHGAQFIPESNSSGESYYAGTLGNIGCFSFYANKIITTGEGGMVVTDSDEIARNSRSLKDLAHSPDKRFLHNTVGYNYRMTNMQAAVGVSQLEEIERFIEIKQTMARTYKELLEDIPGLNLPQEKPWARNVYWMYAVVVEDRFGMSRDELMKELKQRGVDTRTFFVPVHQQPVFAEHFSSFSLPVSEALSQRGFYLPSGMALTHEQMHTVSQVLHTIHSKLR